MPWPAGVDDHEKITEHDGTYAAELTDTKPKEHKDSTRSKMAI